MHINSQSQALPNKKSWLLAPAVHPLIPTLLFLPLSISFLVLDIVYTHHSFWFISGILLSGILLWTFMEYFLHRFFFHLIKVKEPWKSIASGLHMAHHRDTQEKHLIITPQMLAISISGFTYLVIFLISKSWSVTNLMVGGLYLGYMFYEWVHYATHCYNMKDPLSRYLKKYHLHHHFKEPNGAFGVTSPFWDMVFRTYTKIK